MSYNDVVQTLSPEVVARLRRGIETGRWPDGRPLTPQQREDSLQAVIAWEREHLPEQDRVGYIDKGSKGRGDESQTASLRWVADGKPDATGEGSGNG